MLVANFFPSTVPPQQVKVCSYTREVHTRGVSIVNCPRSLAEPRKHHSRKWTPLCVRVRMLHDMQMPVRNVCVHMPRRNSSAERNLCSSSKIKACWLIPVATPRRQSLEDAFEPSHVTPATISNWLCLDNQCKLPAPALIRLPFTHPNTEH